MRRKASLCPDFSLLSGVEGALNGAGSSSEEMKARCAFSDVMVKKTTGLSWFTAQFISESLLQPTF